MSTFKLKEIKGLEYEERDGVLYPKLGAPERKSQSIKERKVIQMLEERNSWILDGVNMSGLGERIFTEIAERATLSAEKTRKSLKSSGMNPTEIEIEAERAETQTMAALIEEVVEATAHLNFKELRLWQLPPQE